jgi:hypothetical protein
LGWLGMKINTWSMIGLSIALIMLIGLSRIYIGVHWVSDVVSGWAFGLFLLIVLLKLEERARPITSKFESTFLYIIIIIFGAVAMVLTEFFSPVMIEGLEANFGPIGGLIIGLGVGLILEKRYVRFEITPKNGEKWRIALRVMIGLVLVFVVASNLSLMVSTNIYWVYAIQYALVTIFVMFIWPFLFKKIGL